VSNQDLVFALHAFALSSVQLAQIFIYDRGVQGNINKFWILFLIANYIVVFVVWAIEVFGHPLPTSTNTLLMMGYCKAAITFVKYLPQVYLNWKRKSVEGFSIENVVLDFMGGSLSFAQSALKAIALGEPFFEPGAFNLVKFILSICSIFFDSIFFIQFCLYRNNKKTKPAPEFAPVDGEDSKGILDRDYAVAPSKTSSQIDKNSNHAY